MDEGSGGAGTSAGAGVGGSSSTLLSGGGRQRFEVQLKPGETTIVSWKKLVKDANKAANVVNHNTNVAPPVPAPPLEPHPLAAKPALDSRIAPPLGEAVANEANDAPPGSRFSAVIEKIERLYVGKNSSDEEDLNDVPDDDEYDTEDSFIDDTELDEYFQVDNSEIKHDGFFVNRGKLERTSVPQNEPTATPSQQPKKRRRRDSAKGQVGSDDGHEPNKHMKINKQAAGKVVLSVEKNSTSPSNSAASPTGNCEDVKRLAPIIALGTVAKKSSDPKSIADPSMARVLNGEAVVTAKHMDKEKTGVLQSKNHVSKLKDGSASSAVPSQRSNDKTSNSQSKSLQNNSEELNQSIQPRDKSIIRSDIKSSENTQQTPLRNPLPSRKEGSSTKSRITILEKAIRDLEKIVAESRPPSLEVTDADNSSQAVKRRMPPEIKQKLAKVARLAHATHGKISKELLNRLMSIVGHLIQIRSLKRNLKNMVNMGLSAKEEKDARLQQLKKEVDEMVKIRAPMMRSKVIEQQAGASDDFQETSPKEKEALKRKITMDDTLEDKICDIYDLFVDGLDEDAGPQVRKLYAELAELWPKGFMDNHGIKRAICRAKDRRKAMYRHKDQENLKRKKLLAPKTETVFIEAGSVAQPHVAPVTDTANSNSLTTGNRSITNTLAANASARVPYSSVNSSNLDRPKQEKLKGTSNHQIDVRASEVLVKKKVKRNPEAGMGEARIRQEKSTAAQGEGRQKSNKQTAGMLPKPAPVSSITASAAPQPPPPTLNSSADIH